MAHSTHGLEYEAAADIDIFEAYTSKQSRPRKSDIRRIRRALRKLNTGNARWQTTAR